ncbi:hypothetical protein CYMTET_25250 [Cymbomonas tetramitiformis]|uniref:PLAT domain-containing protein n=1 Tax=Cymbomonas tetramitiformis TaxID=36881 RepID=A0AAE0KZ46_9CHLO|nr:hypothetical protein CYMTET_25250 [Cymbomonas tetramitiformis]
MTLLGLSSLKDGRPKLPAYQLEQLDGDSGEASQAASEKEEESRRLERITGIEGFGQQGGYSFSITGSSVEADGVTEHATDGMLHFHREGKVTGNLHEVQVTGRWSNDEKASHVSFQLLWGDKTSPESFAYKYEGECERVATGTPTVFGLPLASPRGKQEDNAAEQNLLRTGEPLVLAGTWRNTDFICVYSPGANVSQTNRPAQGTPDAPPAEDSRESATEGAKTDGGHMSMLISRDKTARIAAENDAALDKAPESVSTLVPQTERGSFHFHLKPIKYKLCLKADHASEGLCAGRALATCAGHPPPENMSCGVASCAQFALGAAVAQRGGFAKGKQIYTVALYTSDLLGAASTAQVIIRLDGLNGCTPEIRLTAELWRSNNERMHARNQMDVFEIFEEDVAAGDWKRSGTPSLGDITAVHLALDQDSMLDPGAHYLAWNLDRVEVMDHATKHWFVFSAGCWLDNRRSDAARRLLESRNRDTATATHAENVEVLRKMREVRAENDGLSELLEKRSRIADLDAKLAVARAHSDDLQAEEQCLKEKDLALSTEMAELRRRQEESLAEKAKMEEALARLNTGNAGLQAELAEASQVAERLEQHSTAVEMDCDSRTEALAALRDEVTGLEAQHHTVETQRRTLQCEVEDILAQTRRLDLTLTTAKAVVQNQQRQVELNEQWASQMGELVAKQAARKGALKGQLEEEKAATKEVEAELAATRQQLEQLQADAEEATSRCQAADAHRGEVQRKQAEAQARLAQVEEEAARMMGLLAAMERDLEDRKHHQEQLKAHYAYLHKEVERLAGLSAPLEEVKAASTAEIMDVLALLKQMWALHHNAENLLHSIFQEAKQKLDCPGNVEKLVPAVLRAWAPIRELVEERKRLDEMETMITRTPTSASSRARTQGVMDALGLGEDYEYDVRYLGSPIPAPELPLRLEGAVIGIRSGFTCSHQEASDDARRPHSGVVSR